MRHAERKPNEPVIFLSFDINSILSRVCKGTALIKTCRRLLLNISSFKNAKTSLKETELNEIVQHYSDKIETIMALL